MSESRLFRRVYYTAWEGNSKGISKGIQCWLPSIRPALTGFPCRVEAHDGHDRTARYTHLSAACSLGIGEMTSGLERISDPGVHTLTLSRSLSRSSYIPIYDLPDVVDVVGEGQERGELGPSRLPQAHDGRIAGIAGLPRSQRSENSAKAKRSMAAASVAAV